MITKFRIYKHLNETFSLEEQYAEIFGVPKNDEQHAHMKKWLEEAKKNNAKEEIDGVEAEIKRRGLTGDGPPFYRTMENTYDNVPEVKDQDLLDFYKSKNKVETEEDIEQMMAWYRKRKDSLHHTPEPNYYGKEQRQIPSNKGDVTT
jgi:hypothetical protein